jgi:hypothetical protein
MLLLTGALLSGFLGYRLMGWWAPAAVVLGTLALQVVSYQGVLSTAGGVSGLVQILALSGLTCLFVFYATFSLGRSWGLRRRKQR